MRRRDFIKLGLATGAVMMFTHPVFAAPRPAPKKPRTKPDRKKVTTKDRLAAAKRMREQGFQPAAIGAAVMAMPGVAPRYFSHPNYANSPLPTVEGAVIAVGNVLSDRAYATDNEPGVFVVNPQPLPTGTLQGFQVWNQVNPGGSGSPSAGNTFHAYVLRPTANPNEYTVVFDSGPLTVPATAAAETVTFPVSVAVQAGDLIAHYGQGVPLDIGTGSDGVYYPVPAGPLQDGTITLGGADYPVFAQARTYSFAASVLDLSGANVVVTGGGIRKFVDGLPGLGPDKANNLGQYIPIAVPDQTTYDGCDYYEIAVVEYTEQMHSDLPPTKLRGYVQLSTSVVPGDRVALTNPDGTPITLPDGSQAFAVDKPHYLGPAILATKDKPVRVLFRNLLPTGHYDPANPTRSTGDLFIPVDTTVMGSGMGPLGHDMAMMDPQHPHAGMVPKPYEAYTENRATIHLHGGISPWISDGTPHQWITPANENTPYPKGVSVVNVPDMPDPGPGAMTFFYTNQQSARLMFYHDHAWGITRLNVYAGEAAPYLITDPTEQMLIDQGIIPADQIPLVVQDKTFVPDEAQLAATDELWDLHRWGGKGSLWLPHVYSPIQNPGDSSGTNAFGRWAYGPWFWPPVPTEPQYGPIPNPYYDATCNPDEGWCEPPLMPGVPFNSMGMEAFMDTPVVNGTAYPYVEVEPKAYRFRILNAANDRFFNLSLYKADPAAPTEVQLNPDEVAAALENPTDVFPTPVAGTEGPSWIQIANEGGFLPAPAVIPPHPTTWWADPGLFIVGTVNEHSLLLGPAERADVIVDFSQYAGQTLILYNDAPAAFPARDPRYDYYTGNADLRDAGGAPPTLPGYGPNTRTVMQIKVKATTPAPAFDLAKLETAFKSTKLGGLGVFETSQHPIIVGQGAYNSAYGTAFPTNGLLDGQARITDTSLTFNTLSGAQLTMPLQPKQIQDEQGEAFDPLYGRMSGFLGVESPNPRAGAQNMILLGFVHPPTEVIDPIELAPGVAVTPIGSIDDGTQIWKITHNGVDTHPIHFHLYDVQLLNRVGWDGMILRNDPNELGWKDTVRISPLQDTILALRPLVPHVPFELPNSIRLLDPSMPAGAVIASSTQAEATGKGMLIFDPNGEPIDIVNHEVNFGHEYVWHCHILSHEEMDMMRPQVVGVTPKAPTDLVAVRVGNGNNRRVDLTWTDVSANETAFVVERAMSGTGPWTTLATLPSDKITGPATGRVLTYSDRIGNTNQVYVYRVRAINVVGDTHDYSDPNLNEGAGFPTKTIESSSNLASWVPVPDAPPIAPSAVVATAARSGNQAQVTLTWSDSATNESGYQIQYAGDAGFTTGVVDATVGANAKTYTATKLPRGTNYYFRVRAYNLQGASAWVNATPFPIRTP